MKMTLKPSKKPDKLNALSVSDVKNQKMHFYLKQEIFCFKQIQKTNNNNGEFIDQTQ